MGCLDSRFRWGLLATALVGCGAEEGDEGSPFEDPGVNEPSTSGYDPVDLSAGDADSGDEEEPRPGDLCAPCQTSEDCGDVDDLCLIVNATGERFCGRACDDSQDCPEGFGCEPVADDGGTTEQCAPSSLTCQDSPSDGEGPSGAGADGCYYADPNHVPAPAGPTSGNGRVVWIRFADGTPLTGDWARCQGGDEAPTWSCAFEADEDACRTRLLAELHEIYADFDVEFVFEDPGRPHYKVLLEGGSGALPTGNAPAACEDLFGPSDLTACARCGDEVRGCAIVIAHEHGHMMGLMHTQPGDLMNPISCTYDANEGACCYHSATFADADLPIGGCGGVQNSYRDVMAVLGPRPAAAEVGPNGASGPRVSVAYEVDAPAGGIEASCEVPDRGEERPGT